jgi:hypothetical protein
MPPRKQEDGSFAFFGPMRGDIKLPLIDIERDYGTFVRAAIEEREGIWGNDGEVLTWGEMISLDEVAKTVGEGELISPMVLMDHF